MAGEAFLSNILLNGHYGHVAGLDDITFPMTQNSQSTHGIPSELEPPIDVDVHASRSTKGTKRQKNFHWKEDEVVCSGWLNVSKDPIHGANQTRSTFWGRVHLFFEKNNKTGSVRTESSIMHRWLTIQYQVNKFHACYDAIERRNQSGCTVQDMVCCILVACISFLFYFNYLVFKYIYVYWLNNYISYAGFRCIEDVYGNRGQKRIYAYALLEDTQGGRQVGSKENRAC